ncbi:hypothetical protein BESB_054860 [Besnoitia besnoiti]|uniref:Uncharacterized protein n=1 Tax=Besnoitia besnoiti TaxID=94643 RepID=A0A2A9MCW7_BESBE|nr:hypothetical protein BESB_054860 [Besnoitia besnoiti]PFH35835.1 hypothetical protein BESB_054860 [Besnoitia besnoiti]
MGIAFNLWLASTVDREATVTVDKPATIRAYLEPDGGGSDTEEIELQCEADVDHHLVYEGLKPGTLYRLKLFYVVPERSTVSRLLTSMLSAERSAHASDAGGSSETAVKVRRHKPAAGSVGDTFGRRKVVRRLTAQSTMKPVWIPPRETTKNEVRTLPPDWASTESL